MKERFRELANRCNTYFKNFADVEQSITYHTHRGFWKRPVQEWSRDSIHPNTRTGRKVYSTSLTKAVFNSLRTIATKSLWPFAWLIFFFTPFQQFQFPPWPGFQTIYNTHVQVPLSHRLCSQNQRFARLHIRDFSDQNPAGSKQTSDSKHTASLANHTSLAT